MAIAQIKPPTYQDKCKTRVAHYFTAFPDGDWDRFRKSWPRAHQVPIHKFEEVKRDMQISGAIPMIIGGKAHEFLRKDMEKDILAKHKLDQKPPVTPEIPLLHPGVTAPSPYYSPVQEPVTQSSTPESEPQMAAFNMRKLSSEEREKFVRTFIANNQDTHEELQKKTGYKFPSSLVYQLRSKMRNGTLRIKRADDIGRPKTPVGNYKKEPPQPQNFTETPDLRTVFIAIPRPQIYNAISMEGRSAETIKALKDALPSVLAEILNPKMKFQCVIYDLPNEDGKDIPHLEVRRTV